jgi:hypothetical protein
MVSLVLLFAGFSAGLFTSWALQQQSQRAQGAERALLEDRRLQQATLEAYRTQMDTYILKEGLRRSEQGDRVRKLARSQTLTVLERLGPEAKGSVVRYLYEGSLIDKERPLVDLRDADLSEAELGPVELRGADLKLADLEGADLSEANLFGADLYEASLAGANLSGSDLSFAGLYDADLSGADLTDASLASTYLSEADLSEADLFGADLSCAYLWNGRPRLARSSWTRASTWRVPSCPTGRGTPEHQQGFAANFRERPARELRRNPLLGAS